MSVIEQIQNVFIARTLDAPYGAAGTQGTNGSGSFDAVVNVDFIPDMVKVKYINYYLTGHSGYQFPRTWASVDDGKGSINTTVAVGNPIIGPEQGMTMLSTNLTNEGIVVPIGIFDDFGTVNTSMNSRFMLKKPIKGSYTFKYVTFPNAQWVTSPGRIGQLFIHLEFVKFRNSPYPVKYIQ
jgi:hypothetical protein